MVSLGSVGFDLALRHAGGESQWVLDMWILSMTLTYAIAEPNSPPDNDLPNHK